MPKTRRNKGRSLSSLRADEVPSGDCALACSSRGRSRCPAAAAAACPMGIEHDVVPQPCRQGAAGDLVHGRAVVIADPHARHIVRGVADEPGVAKALASCRSCRRPDLVGDAPPACRCRRPRSRSSCRSSRRRRAAPRPGRCLERLRSIEHLAVAVAHLGDDVGQHAAAAIGEGRVGAGQLEQRDLRGAERDRRRVACSSEWMPSRRAVRITRQASDVAGELHGHRVDRLGERCRAS